MSSPTGLATGIIGIDAATDDTKVGLAFGLWHEGAVTLRDVSLPTRSCRPVDVIAQWLAEVAGPVLLAVDAPLGWPTPLSTALASHTAGEEVRTPPNEMFRRMSDRFIQTTFGKTPLDVGADRIARTAHAALRLLAGVRRGSGLEVPLAWSPKGLPQLSAIEVYPAATLLAHGYRSDGYKKPRNVIERESIVVDLRKVMELPPDASLLERNPDALDAVVCVLAGKDFLDGRTLPPQDLDVARREGWIWVSGQAHTRD